MSTTTLQGRDPRLSPAGYLAHSRQGTVVIRDLRTLGVLAEHPGNRIRLDGATASWRQQENGDDLKFTLRAVASASDWRATVADTGLEGDVFEAAGGHWYTHAKKGVNTLYKDGQPYLVGEEYGPLVAVRGDWLAIHLRPTDWVMVESVSTGEGWEDSCPFVPWSLDVCEGYAVASHGRTVGWTPEKEQVDLTIGQEQRARLFTVNGAMWVVSEVPRPSTGQPAAFARPWGQQEGLLFAAAGGYLRGICYQNEIVVASSDTAGTLIVDRLPANAPRKRLEEYSELVVQPVAPYTFHCVAAAYKDNDYDCPGTHYLLPDYPSVAPPVDRPLVWSLDERDKVPLAQIAAWHVHAEDDPTGAALEGQAAKGLRDIPVYAYLGSYVPDSRIPNIDAPIIQCYALPGTSTPEAILAKAKADIARCGYRRVALALEAGNGRPGAWLTPGQSLELMQLWAELIREVRPLAVFPFADDRAGGMAFQPALKAQWAEIVKAIPVEESVMPPWELGDLLRQFAAMFGVPRRAGGQSQDDFENECRGWTYDFAQQAKYSTRRNYGSKRAGGPQSKDSIALEENGLWGWDLLAGVGTGTPTLIDNPATVDLAGQTFIAVEPYNWLGEPQPDPPSDTVPVPRAEVEAFRTFCQEQAIRAHNQGGRLENWAEMVEGWLG